MAARQKPGGSSPAPVSDPSAPSLSNTAEDDGHDNSNTARSDIAEAHYQLELARADVAALRIDLDRLREAKTDAEQAQSRLEKEMVELSASLFTKANQMVSEERVSFSIVQKRLEDELEAVRMAAKSREDRLLAQLADARELQSNLHQQLNELKDVMVQMEDEQRALPLSSHPSARQSLEPADCDSDDNDSSGSNAVIIPDQTPLAFADVIQPVFRTDLDAYTELAELVAAGRVALAEAAADLEPPGSPHHQRDSALGFSSLALPASLTGPVKTIGPSGPATQGNRVRESRLYQRLLIEDLDPGLRIDKAPALNFFSRRAFMNGLLAGSLTIEPLTADFWARAERMSSGPPPKKTGFSGLGLTFGFRRRDTTDSSGQTGEHGAEVTDDEPDRSNRMSMTDATAVLAKMIPAIGHGSGSTDNQSRPTSVSLSSPADRIKTGGDGSTPSTPPSSTAVRVAPSAATPKCSLCTRSSTAEHPFQGKPTHMMRVGDLEPTGGSQTTGTAPRLLPLCDWCVGRIRACVELVAFLRLVAAGLWQTAGHGTGDGGDREATYDAWIELCRLRERLFWRRTGGGVRLVSSSRTRVATPIGSVVATLSNFPVDTPVKNLPEDDNPAGQRDDLTIAAEADPTITIHEATPVVRDKDFKVADESDRIVKSEPVSDVAVGAVSKSEPDTAGVEPVPSLELSRDDIGATPDSVEDDFASTSSPPTNHDERPMLKDQQTTDNLDQSTVSDQSHRPRPLQELDDMNKVRQQSVSSSTSRDEAGDGSPSVMSSSAKPSKTSSVDRRLTVKDRIKNLNAHRGS